MGNLNLLHSARSLPLHTSVNPRLQALLICWHQEASFPQHRGPALPAVPDSKRAFAPLSKSKNARFPTEGRKTINCYSAGGTRSSVLPRHTEAQCFTLHLLVGELCMYGPRAGIPAPTLSGNPLPCWS
jgi:hypothetical protein